MADFLPHTGNQTVSPSLAPKLGAPCTLQACLSSHLTKVGRLGCHQPDELLLPTLKIQNLEVRGGFKQHAAKKTGRVLHCRLVLAHEVEQSAHLPPGVVRPPACLKREGGLRSDVLFHRAR